MDCIVNYLQQKGKLMKLQRVKKNSAQDSECSVREAQPI